MVYGYYNFVVGLVINLINQQTWRLVVPPCLVRCVPWGTMLCSMRIGRHVVQLRRQGHQRIRDGFVVGLRMNDAKLSVYVILCSYEYYILYIFIYISYIFIYILYIYKYILYIYIYICIRVCVCVPASMYADIYIVIHCMIHSFNNFDCMCTCASTCIYIYI